MDLKKKIAEAYGRNRGYAHGFASPHAPSLGGRREREDDEGWDREPQHKPADHPHSVHINGKKWKTFGSQSHATNVAKKIAGATVHKEEVQIDELSDKTLGNYVTAARADRANNKQNMAAGDTAQKINAMNKDKKRQAGMNKAKSYLMPGTAGHAKNQARRAANEEVHRIGLTVTDPNHPMVSKRKETIQKSVRVTGDDREKAINSAIAHYRRKGYKVHDHHYIGTVNEVSDKTLTNYLTKVHDDSLKHDKDPTKRSAAKRNKSVAGFSRAFNKLDSRKPDGSMNEDVEQIVEYGDIEYGGAYVNGRSDDALQTAKLTRQAKAAAKKAGKTFNTSAEYRLWHMKQKPKKQGVAEEIVHTRTGANGTKYHIKQDSPSDYSVHREVNGKLKHIDTYGSLHRAKQVLDNEVKEEVELDEAAQGHTIEAHGIRGMKGTPWRKTFKSHEHLNDWAEKNDSVEVHGTRELEKAKKVNEETGAYEKSEENKRSADAAKKQGNMFDHHMHMADYHDNLAQWHSERGRHSVADTHAAKSDEHHKQAMKLKEDTNMDTRIWEAWGMGKRDPQKGIKVGHQVRSYDFPGMHDDHYIEGHVVGETPHSYHIRTSKVVRAGKEVPIPAHMGHVEAPKGRGMFSDAYAVHKIVAKQDAVAAKPEPAKGGAKTFANLRGKR